MQNRTHRVELFIVQCIDQGMNIGPGPHSS
jgi:hypothetical protein